MSFSPQLQLCDDFPGLRFSSVFWIYWKGAIIIICNTDIYPEYPPCIYRKSRGRGGWRKQKDTFLTGCFVKQELQTLLILCAVHD